MSVDNLTRPELQYLLDRLKAAREWKHLPEHYADAGQRVRRAYVQGDRKTAIRISVWAETALRTEHKCNRTIARKLFNGETNLPPTQSPPLTRRRPFWRRWLAW